MSMLSMFGVTRKQKTVAMTGREQAPDPEREHRDRLGPLLTQHENPTNQNRSNQIVVRVLLGGFGLSMASNIILGVTLSEVFPLHTVSPYLVTFSDKADQMVRIDPPTSRISSVLIVMQNEVRQYMSMRYTVTADMSETMDRWATHVRLFSSNRVYGDFQAEMAPIVDLMKSRAFTRQIRIVNTLRPEPNLFHVDFDIYNHKTGQGLTDTSETIEHYTAELRMVMQPQIVPRSAIELNPFGFVVTSYTVSQRHDSR